MRTQSAGISAQPVSTYLVDTAVFAYALDQGRAAARLCLLHPFDTATLERSFELIDAHPGVRGRDAVHAATAFTAGIGVIISPDHAFDGVAGLERIDPRTVAASCR